MKALSVSNMKHLENLANESGYSFEKMMKRAGSGLAEIVDREYKIDSNMQVAGLIGPGNNGGDTMIALTELMEKGWQCTAFFTKKDCQPVDLIQRFTSLGGETFTFDSSQEAHLKKYLKECRLILDGVNGTGIKLPLRSPSQEFLLFVKNHLECSRVIAVDCPSGVDCETGEVSPETLHAELTVCMGGIKNGLLKFPAFEYCGRFEEIELGIPEKIHKQVPNDEVMDHNTIKSLIPKRPLNSHKGQFGKLTVSGGSINFTGAPILSAKAAYKTGCGLVQLAIPESIYQSVATESLESIWLLLEDEGGVINESAATTLLNSLTGSDCLLIGPGLGRENVTLKFINATIYKIDESKQKNQLGFIPKSTRENQKLDAAFPPMVIDADGLQLLSKTPEWWKRLKSKVILTPHPGEMSVLTGLSTEKIQTDRVEVARKFAVNWGQIIVLKGAITVIASPEGKVSIVPLATSALAKAGTGDVLAGMISGLVCQGVPLYDAAKVGVWLHARAGILAAEHEKTPASVMAGDVIEFINNAIAE